MRTNSTASNDLIGIKDVGNGIQVHRERKQKAETYVLTYPLNVDGLEINGSMIQLAIEMAKLAQETGALGSRAARCVAGAISRSGLVPQEGDSDMEKREATIGAFQADLARLCCRCCRPICYRPSKKCGSGMRCVVPTPTVS